MKCPHCSVHIHPKFSQTTIKCSTGIEYAKDGYPVSWEINHMICPSCKKTILQLIKGTLDRDGRHQNDYEEPRLIYPSHASLRSPAPIEVPAELREDFNEAIAVLDLSPKASAALSRRCLEGLLKDQGYEQKKLVYAIKAVLDSNTLPNHLATIVDAIRNIGNFAVHPTEEESSSSIVPVEPHEAEWNLEVLEELFDFYYVRPTITQKKKDAINDKLKSAGKNPINQ